MPITFTRNSSISRWRRTTSAASRSPDAVSRTPAYGSYFTSPDSASALTIVVAVPGTTPRARGELAHRHELAFRGQVHCAWKMAFR